MAAAQNVAGNLNLNISLTQSQSTGVVGSSAGGGTQSLQALVQVADQLANGTGSAKTCDQLYAKQLTFVATTPQTLHFGNGTATDPFGNTITMARIRLILVQVVDATAGHDLKVESAAANGIAWLPAAAAPGFARANGGVFMAYDPNSNGAGVGNTISGTTDGMTLDPGSNAINAVNVVVLGDSVA